MDLRETGRENGEPLNYLSDYQLLKKGSTSYLVTQCSISAIYYFCQHRSVCAIMNTDTKKKKRMENCEEMDLKKSKFTSSLKLHTTWHYLQYLK
jgi:hypothetical protein